MPRAGDAFLTGPLPRTHDPTVRINHSPPKTVIDPEQLLQMWMQWFEDYGLQIFQEFIGLDFSSPEAFLASLINLLVTGGPALDLATAILDMIGNSIGVPNLGSVLTSLSALPIGELTTLFEGLLNGGVPVNVRNLFGQLPQSLFGLIHPSAIGGDSPDLLSNGPFNGSISVDGAGIWEHDAADGHTTNGCVKTTANGTFKALHANAVDVSKGQEIDLSVWTKSVSYIGSGTPIRMGVRKYLYNPVTRTEVEVGTATTIVSRTGANASWTQMTGTYTVPADGTINRIRMRLVVDTTATGGTVKFDDAAMVKEGNGPFDGVLDMLGLSALDDLIGLDVNDRWSNIITNIMNPLSLIQDNVIRTFVQNILGAIVQAIRRIPLIGDELADQLDDASDAMLGQNESLVGLAAVTGAIQAALSPGNTDADEFERSGSWGASWGVYEDGVGGDASLDGHNAVWTGDYGNDTEMVARRLSKQAAGDNQTAAVVLASSSAAITDGNAAIDLWLRCTNFTTWATRTGCRFRFWADKTWQLHWFNSGTGTLLASGSHSKGMGASTALSFEAGQGLTPRRFVAKINNEPIMDFTEAGTTSQFGASYLWRGVGARAEFSLIMFPPLEMNPGKLKQWTATG
jgi:hypothetical protein